MPENFEAGWKFPDKWIGGSHWFDVTEHWPKAALASMGEGE